MHFIETTNFLLDIAFVHIVYCVDDLGARRWRLILTLLCLIVVIIVLLIGPDFMVYIGHRVSKRIKIFWGMFLTHKGVIFFLLKADFDGNTTTMEISLAIKILYCQ